MEQIPNDVGVRPYYTIIGSTNKDYPLGKRVVLDTYSGGSETKIFDPTNERSFVSYRKKLNLLENKERMEFFGKHPTMKVVEHFVILEGNIAAFDNGSK